MGTVNIYPPISEFLKQLDAYEPHHNLLDYIMTFGALNFYHINEIAGLGNAEEIIQATKNITLECKVHSEAGAG